MPAPAAPGPAMPRRAVLLGVLGSGALLASGCGIRLEDDAPDIPLVPEREPIGAEGALVGLTLSTQALAEAAAATPGALAAALAPIHHHQHEVLRDALLSRGVPSRLVSPAASPSPSSPSPIPSPSSPSPTPSPSSSSSTAAALSSLEARALDAPTAYSGADADLRPTVVSLLAQRATATTLLRGKAPPGPGGVAPVWLAPAGLAPVITAGRAAAYLLEVAAAQGSGATRSRALRDLATVGLVLDAQLLAAGVDAPAPDLGQPLPFPVRNPAQAKRLAKLALSDLRAAYGSALAGLTAGDPRSSLLTVPWWLGSVEVMAHDWGVALEPFPGLGG